MFESCVKITYCIKNQKQWLIVILCFDKTDETKFKKKKQRYEIDQSLNMSLDITCVCLSLIVVSIITT